MHFTFTIQALQSKVSSIFQPNIKKIICILQPFVHRWTKDTFIFYIYLFIIFIYLFAAPKDNEK